MRRTGRQKMDMISKTQHKLDVIESKKILFDIIQIALRLYKKKPSEALETRLREMKQTYENIR